MLSGICLENTLPALPIVTVRHLAQVLRFMDCYLPAYKLYTPELYAQGPTTARPGHVLAVTVDRDRNPTSIAER